MKYIAPLLAYLAVGIGLYVFHSAWGALIGFHVAIIVSLVIAKPGIPVSILFKGRSLKWIFLSILLCASSGVILYFCWNSFGFANNLAQQIELLGLNKTNRLTFIAYFVLVNPLVEEYFWRGYLGNKTKSLHTSDFMYAGFHALILFNKVQTGSIIFGLVMLVVAGWFWRQVARKDEGLLAPVLGHMAADLAVLFAVYKWCYKRYNLIGLGGMFNLL